jgi:hypothetical protein
MEKREASEEAMAYFMGFSTHAVLDRLAHPFIDYHAGWVIPKRPETRKYYRCHAFFERILDVLILKEKRGVFLRDYDFRSLVYCGRDLPGGIIDILYMALQQTYPGTSVLARGRQRISNAYHDAMLFYRYTDNRDPTLFAEALRWDHGKVQKRRSSLFHPPVLPAGVDLLNRENRKWFHPCDGDDERRSSFLDIYEAAVDQAAALLKEVWEIFAGRTGPQGFGRRLGSQSLNTTKGGGKPLRYCDPLPLADFLESLGTDPAFMVDSASDAGAHGH